MLSHKSDYSQSARALAAAAYKVSIIINGLVCSYFIVSSLLIFVVQEAEEEAKHSSSKKRVTTVVQG